MSENLFAEEKCVIISSTDRITMRQWRTHLASNWEKLMPENTRLLVLAEIHVMVRKTGGWGTGRSQARMALWKTARGKCKF